MTLEWMGVVPRLKGINLMPMHTHRHQKRGNRLSPAASSHVDDKPPPISR